MHGSRSDQVATVMVTSLACCRKENVPGRRSTRSATLAQNGRSDTAVNAWAVQYRQISVTLRARGTLALAKPWLLFVPHALAWKIIGFAHMHISNLEYEATTFIRQVEHHPLSGAKPLPGLDENSHAPTVPNRAFIWKCVTVQPFCAQYIEHCLLSQVCWCDVFQVSFLSILSRLLQHWQILLFLGSFAFSQKTPITFITSASLSVCVSGRPSACISTVPTGRICVKFDTGDFYETLSWNFKFC
jgi:hypothetical protein